MTGLALADVIRVLRLPDTGAAVDDPAVDVLVVDGKDAAAAGIEQRHAVVVVTERPFLTGPGAARVLVERDRVRPHRIAPPGDDMPTVARRHRHRVEGVGRDRLERDGPGRGAGGQRREAGGAHDERRGAERDRAAEVLAARDRPLGEPVEVGPFRARVVHLVEIVERQDLFRCGMRRLSHVNLQVRAEAGDGPGRVCTPEHYAALQTL